MVLPTDLRRGGEPPVRAVHRIGRIFSLNKTLTFHSEHDAFQERKVQSAVSDGLVSKNAKGVLHVEYVEYPLLFLIFLRDLS